MVENLVSFFIDLFSGLNKNLVLLLISCMPIIELRGGLIAASLLKINLLTGFIYDESGNKTEIFNTILRLTPLDEETVIKLMENETANDILTDIVNSIYD